MASAEQQTNSEGSLQHEVAKMPYVYLRFVQRPKVHMFDFEMRLLPANMLLQPRMSLLTEEEYVT